MARMVKATQIYGAQVERWYRSTASAEEVAAFYEEELGGMGWAQLEPPPPDPRVTSSPLRAWEKGSRIARIDVRPVRGQDGNPVRPSAVEVRFSIVEVLGPEATPGVPWDD